MGVGGGGGGGAALPLPFQRVLLEHGKNNKLGRFRLHVHLVYLCVCVCVCVRARGEMCLVRGEGSEGGAVLQIESDIRFKKNGCRNEMNAEFMS